jgi:hypothetical protein
MFIIKREMFVVYSGVASFFDVPETKKCNGDSEISYEIKKKSQLFGEFSFVFLNNI